jgi:hypothetical protein
MKRIFELHHHPREDTMWAGYLMLHILANPPHMEIVNLKARKQLGKGGEGKEWFDKQHFNFQRRLNEITINKFIK